MKFLLTIAIICLLSVLSPWTIVYGADSNWKTLEVPSSIEIKEDITSVPEGWFPSREETKHVLSGITVFDGRPEEMASLVYDSESKDKSRHRMILGWKLYPNTKDGIWLRCNYASTNVNLNAPLPPQAKEIRVVYDTEVHIDGLPQIVQIEYRE